MPANYTLLTAPISSASGLSLALFGAQPCLPLGRLQQRQALLQQRGHLRRAGPRFSPDQQTCLVQFREFVNSLLRNDEWARKVIDSWGKIQAGIWSGNRYDFGHFDQCVAFRHSSPALVQEFSTQHCQLELGKDYTKTINAVMGVCVPETCSEESLRAIFGRFLANIPLELVTTEPLHCTTADKPDFDVQQWVVVSLLIVLGVFLLSSTIYDTVKAYQGAKSSEILSAFSISRNLDALFAIRPESTPLEFLNGIRVFSVLWIILYYAFDQYRRMVAVYNPSYLNEFQKTAGRTYVSQGDFAADTFFLISGTLMTYNLLKSLEVNWTFNVLKFWSHRYLRLLPAFGVVILLLTTFGRYIGKGPAFEQVNEKLVSNCEEYWWTSILFVQNYVNPTKLCIEPSWYISVDMQFYLIAPFIIFPLRRLGFRFVPIVAFLALGSLGFIFGYSLAQRFHFNFLPEEYLRYVYLASHARVTQWLVGVILGFVLYKKEGKGNNIHPVMTLLLWVLAVATLWTVVFLPLPAYENGTEDVVAFAFYEALHRFSWALSLAWVIYACFKGLGLPATWFLSFPIFQPLARLSYSAFILQYPVLVITTSLQRNPEYFSEYMAFNLFILVTGLSLLFAIPLTLFIEMPVLNVERGLYDAYNRSVESNDRYFDRNQPSQRSFFKIPRLRVEKKTAF